MSSFRYGRWIMAFGATALFAAAFLPFAMIFLPGSIPIFGTLKPMDVWWFGYPITITAVILLILSMLRSSRRKCLIFIVAGVAILSTAIVVAFTLHNGNDDIYTIPYAFLAMVISGLIFIATGLLGYRRISHCPSELELH